MAGVDGQPAEANKKMKGGNGDAVQTAGGLAQEEEEEKDDEEETKNN